MYRTVGWLARIRDALAKSRFLHGRDLFPQTLALVFIDTTSTFIHRTEQTKPRHRGYSRERMQDYPLVVTCLAVDSYGWSVAWDRVSGSTADTRAFLAMINKLSHPQEARSVACARPQDSHRKRRLHALPAQMGAISIEREAVARDAHLDGKFVLRTSTDFPAADVACAYKRLWRVERRFRETRNTLQVRPVFHHHDDTTIGHVVGWFLALRLEVDRQRRLDDRDVDASWPDIMRDLDQLKAVDVNLDGYRNRLRTELLGHASAVLATAGVRAPSVVMHLEDEPAVCSAWSRLCLSIPTKSWYVVRGTVESARRRARCTARACEESM